MRIITIDTETADLTGNVYDIGYIIHDKQGNIELERNFLVREIFTNPDIMMGGFYAKKTFSHYAPMLNDGSIKLESWQTITETMREDFKNADVLAAYNLGFDLRVLKKTHNALIGNAAPIFSAPVKLLDIWQFACETKLSQKLYRQLATEQGWVSAAGNLKTNAECAYRFCSGEWGFIEQHTALDDAQIEMQILKYCFASKKKIPYGVYNKAPWKIVNSKKA